MSAESVGSDATRGPRRAWILGVAAALGLAALAASWARRSGAAGRVHPPLPREYDAVARALADDLRSDPKPAASPGLAEALAKVRAAAADLRGLESPDPALAELAARARADLDEVADHLGRIAALGDEPPYAALLGESFLRGLVFDFAGGLTLARDYVARNSARLDEARAMLGAIARGEAARLDLPAIAARYAGPAATGGPVLGVDLDPAWQFAGPDDRLALVNRSGRDLHRCTVLVELRGPAGADRAVHFVPLWPAGAARHARYGRGFDLDGRAVGRRTPGAVREVVVSLWADELAQEGVAHPYAESERDADAAREARDLRLEASYRRRSRGLLGTSHRRVDLTLHAPGPLDRPRVTITFRRRDGASKAWTWTLERWAAGATRTLDTGGDLPWDPDEFDVEVAFPDARHVHRGSWSVR